MSDLILSLFPGIGLLDMAAEEEGFTVVRGPDVLWGGDIRRFHPPAGVFWCVIGGPPCQNFSKLAFLQKWAGREPKFGNLIPEFERCVREARPACFIMENVEDAPVPAVAGYRVHAQLLNNRWLGAEQSRTRRISFGTADGCPLPIEYAILESPIPATVTARHPGRMSWQAKVPSTVTSSDGGKGVKMNRYSYPEACRLQGLPDDFLKDAPFRADAKLQAVANGVPLPMGRAIFQAVKRAMAEQAA